MCFDISMTKFTKTFFAVAFSIGATLTFTGCASDPAPKTDAITVWVDELEAKALEKAAAEFKKDTKVTVDLVVQQDPRSNFLSQAATGGGPDVLIGAHDWVGELYANGLILPIDLGGKKGDFYDNAVAAFNYEGQNYGLPYTIENLAIVCNAKKFEKLQAWEQPNWQQVKEVGLALSLNAGGGDPYHLYPIQTSFGAHVFKKDSNGNYIPELDLANGGVEFAKWLSGEGKTMLDPASTWDSSVAALKSGSKGCWITGPWAKDQLGLDSAEFNIYSIPSVGGKDAVSFLSSRGFYVSKSSKDSFYATKFVVDYVAKSENQKELFAVTGRIPANKSAFDAADDDRVVKGFGNAGRNAEPLPAIPAMGSVWASWGSSEIAIIKRQGSPETIWNQMIADIKSSMTQ
jgi:arabinogalactan oligomer/maltooligosaccharide transport system substrate-binding protein